MYTSPRDTERPIPTQGSDQHGLPKPTPRPRGSGNAKLPGVSRHKNSTTGPRNHGGSLGPDESATSGRTWRFAGRRASRAPRPPGDVLAVVRGSREAGDPLCRARGRGHVAVPGANGIDDGILMAMPYLTRISIAPGRASVDAGPGLAWEDVYAYLIDFERTAVGGLIVPIGIAGLTLGGRIGFQGTRAAAADHATYNTDPLSHILPLVEVVNQTIAISLVLFYDSATEPNLASLEQFLAIPATDSTVAEFVIERNGFSIPDIDDVLIAGTAVSVNGDDVLAATQLTHDVFFGIGF
ncbi:hypothetical protein DL765_009043 [Monosporascus sp. GIB2]|nr:hypothetical protein DL765_009043 [Monosporascus sp. GIB2]